MNNFNLFIIGAIAVSVLQMAGCTSGNNLDRSLARELLLNETEFQKEITSFLLVEHSAASEGSAPRMKKQWEEWITSLSGSGLVEDIKTWDGERHRKYSLTLTERGLTYARGEIREHPHGSGAGKIIDVVVYDRNFNEITGISFPDDTKSTALVEYTISHTPTPFAELSMRFTSTPYKLEPLIAKQARFRLYDDGWRVESTGME